MKYIDKCEQKVSPEDIKNVRKATMILAEWMDDFTHLYNSLSNRIANIEKVVSLMLEKMWVEVDVIPATESKVVLKKSKKRK